jgi:hypothetical protein
VIGNRVTGEPLEVLGGRFIVSPVREWQLVWRQMMKHFPLRPRTGLGLAATPVCLWLMAGTAHAALTADQVWQSWKDAGLLAGMTISAATEAKDGGALMLNGVSIVSPEGTALTISDMVLAEQGDGSVTITPGADIGMDYSGGSGDTVSLDVTHDGLVITARDDAGALVYDYSAASLAAAFNSSYGTLGGEGNPDAKPASTNGKVGFEGLSGTYSDTPGDNRAFGMEINAGTLSYDITTDAADLGMKTVSTSRTADISIGMNVTMPKTVSLLALQSAADFQTALQEGFAFSARTKQGVSEGAASQVSEFMPYEMTMTAQPGEATFDLTKDAFNVQSQGEGLALNLSSSMMPVPVAINAGPVQFTMQIPVTSGDAASDFAYVTKISQLSVNEEAWAMVDPGGALAHDPADLSIDVTGKAKVDFMGMMVADEAGTMPPMPAPEVLNINDVSLKLAGAALAASGAFTFDNSAGLPVPLGEANVTLTGGNALIDGLIATGVITEEDAMGARMAMGMFMAPGADADTLTSKIEAKAGNEIYVNGQRIQ